MKYQNVIAKAKSTVEQASNRRGDADYVCSNCGARGMWVFYQALDVPVHTCLMLNDEQTARGFPRRPISLAFCRSCGFVSNVVFDHSVHDYAGGYEDQQSFSGRFRAFQTELIERLIGTYQLMGKRMLEIGCGKGDFLVELCRKAKAQGVGIDPRCDYNDGDSKKITFIPELFGPQHRKYAPDFVCCRHTLEHLPDTERFIATLRKALNDRPRARVFFEVPDAGRVWREHAFWDVNYEHCSYFTAGSLAEVFRRNRFEVLEADLVFGRQYLILVARPVESRSSRRVAIEETPVALEQDIASFSTGVQETIAHWRERITAWHASGRRLAVWGAGSKSVALLSTLDCADAIHVIVDINPRQQGNFLPGIAKQIMSPDALPAYKPDVVLIMNSNYREEIGAQLDQMGLKPELIGL